MTREEIESLSNSELDVAVAASILGMQVKRDKVATLCMVARALKDTLEALEAAEQREKALRELLAEALPYVQRAYDYSFPDEETNRRIATDIEAVLAKESA